MKLAWFGWWALIAWLPLSGCGPSARGEVGLDASPNVNADAATPLAPRIRFTFHHDISGGQAYLGLRKADGTMLQWQAVTQQSNELPLPDQALPQLQLLAAYKPQNSAEPTLLYAVDEVGAGDNIFAGDRTEPPVNEFTMQVPLLAGADAYAVYTSCGTGSLPASGSGTLQLACSVNARENVLVEARINDAHWFLVANDLSLPPPVQIPGLWQLGNRFSAQLQGLPIANVVVPGSFVKQMYETDIRLRSTSASTAAGDFWIPPIAGEGSVLLEFGLSANARMSIREADPLNNNYAIDVAPRLLPTIVSAVLQGGQVVTQVSGGAVQPDAQLVQLEWPQTKLVSLATWMSPQPNFKMPSFPAPVASWLPTTRPASLFVGLISVNPVIVGRTFAYDAIKQSALDETGYWHQLHGTSTFGPIELQ